MIIILITYMNKQLKKIITITVFNDLFISFVLIMSNQCIVIILNQPRFWRANNLSWWRWGQDRSRYKKVGIYYTSFGNDTCIDMFIIALPNVVCCEKRDSSPLYRSTLLHPLRQTFILLTISLWALMRISRQRFVVTHHQSSNGIFYMYFEQ